MAHREVMLNTELGSQKPNDASKTRFLQPCVNARQRNGSVHWLPIRAWNGASGPAFKIWQIGGEAACPIRDPIAWFFDGVASFWRKAEIVGSDTGEWCVVEKLDP